MTFLSYEAKNLYFHARATNDYNERGNLQDWYRICDPFTTRRRWDGKGEIIYTVFHMRASSIFGEWRACCSILLPA